MTVVTGLFDTQEEAATAVRALRDAGIDNTDISLVANGLDSVIDYENELADDTGTGAGVGAVLGGAGGLLAGLGLLTIPGIGPVVAGGWLLATGVGAVAGAVVGGAAGGFIGALTAAGISEDDAISMIVNGFCKDVFSELPLEFAVEAQKLLAISLEQSVG